MYISYKVLTIIPLMIVTKPRRVCALGRMAPGCSLSSRLFYDQIPVKSVFAVSDSLLIGKTDGFVQLRFKSAIASLGLRERQGLTTDDLICNLCI